MKNSKLEKYIEKNNKTIKILNKHGFKIEKPIRWVDFRDEGLEKFQREEMEVSGKKLSEKKKNEYIEKLRAEYPKKLKTHLNDVLKTLDVEKATQIIVKEQAKEFVKKKGFAINGFVMYINQRVFEIDMSAALEVILYKLIFEWYDLSEEKRNIYRNIAKLKGKSTPKVFNTIKEGLIDLDVSMSDGE